MKVLVLGGNGATGKLVIKCQGDGVIDNFSSFIYSVFQYVNYVFRYFFQGLKDEMSDILVTSQ